LPIGQDDLEEGVEGVAVVGVEEMAEFVGDDVIDAGWWCLDEFGVEVDDAAFGATAPAFGHGSKAELGWRFLEFREFGEGRDQAAREGGAGVFAVPGCDQSGDAGGVAFFRGC